MLWGLLQSKSNKRFLFKIMRNAYYDFITLFSAGWVKYFPVDISERGKKILVQEQVCMQWEAGIATTIFVNPNENHNPEE